MTDSPTSDFLPLDEIAALGRRRWRDQRRYVAGQSRFFRGLWSGIEPPERLEDLPRLPLADKSMLRRSQAETPPFGDYLAAPEDRAARLHRTGGTTGQATAERIAGFGVK